MDFGDFGSMMLRIIAATSLATLTASVAIGSLPELGRSETKVATSITTTKSSTKASTSTPDDDLSGMSGPVGEIEMHTKGEPVWISEGAASAAETLMSPEIAQKIGQRRRAGSMQKSLEVRPAVQVTKKPVRLADLGLDQNGEYLGTGRLLIKFKDDVKARASIFPGMPVVSLTGRNTNPLNEIMMKQNATVRQAINMTEAEIEKVRQIAFDRSNRIQPDLASMMKVEFPDQKKPNWPVLLQAAKEINALAEIEYVLFEPVPQLDQSSKDCDDPPTYPCNLPNPDGKPDPARCWDNNVNIPAPLDAECNGEQDCSTNETCVVGCEDGTCCNFVSSNELYAYCNDVDDPKGWDVACAAYANQICSGSVYLPTDRPDIGYPSRYDPCLSNYQPGAADDDETYTNDPLKAQRLGVFSQAAASLLGSCFEANPSGRGCQSPACCATICVLHPSCCGLAWDQTCAGYANSGDFPACTGDEANEATPVMGMGAPWLFMPQAGSGNTAIYPVGNWGDIDGAWPPDVNNWNTYFTGTTYSGPAVFLPENPTQAEKDAYDAFFDFDPQTQRPRTPYQGWTGLGLDVDLAAQTVGVIWRIYGGGATSPVIANPNIVWLGGAEWELVPASECTTDDCYDFGGSWDEATSRYTPPKLPTPMEPENQLKYPFTSFCVDLGFNYTAVRLQPTGRRQDVAICEFSAFDKHEEWTEALVDPSNYLSARVPSTTNKIIVEPGVEQELTNEENANHGLACLGVTVAPNNGFGVTGIAPYAQGWFFPIESVNEGSRIETCFASMINLLPEGAIVSNSWGFAGGCGGERFTLAAVYYPLIRAMSDAGLVVLQSAGNDSSAMGAEANPTVDSGLIKVGAAYAGAPLFLSNQVGGCEPSQCFGTPQRISFSNYFTADSEGTVDMFAWGEYGLTTGSGGLFRGEDTRPGINPEERPYTRSYQGPSPSGAGGFNGTSFACPQVAGSFALIQGAAQMFWGQPFNGDLLKAAYSIPANSNAAAYFEDRQNCTTRGYPDCVDVCPQNSGILDRKTEDCEDCAGILTGIGKPVRFQTQMIAIVTTPIVTPGDSLEVYTGTAVAGGVISITSQDGAVATIVSEFASAGPGPGGVPYFGTGQTIDFGVTLRTTISEATVQEAQLRSVGRANGSLNIEVPFLRNRITGRWDYVGSNILTPVTAPNIYPLNIFGSAGAYFSPDYRVDLRMYTIGLGFSTGGGFSGSWDFITVDQSGPIQPI